MARLRARRCKFYCYENVANVVEWGYELRNQLVTPEQAQALGAGLRSRREAHGLSLRGLEARSGVQNIFIVQLEAGRVSKPDSDKLTQSIFSLRKKCNLSPSSSFTKGS